MFICRDYGNGSGWRPPREKSSTFATTIAPGVVRLELRSHFRSKQPSRIVRIAIAESVYPMLCKSLEKISLGAATVQMHSFGEVHQYELTGNRAVDCEKLSQCHAFAKIFYFEKPYAALTYCVL